MRRALVGALLLFSLCAYTTDPPYTDGGSRSAPGGNSGTLQYNNGGTLGGVSGFTISAGVICDGTTDNATSINAAIVSANTAGGGTVLLPAGTCAVGSTIVMQTGISLKGAGRDATTIKALSSLSGATDMVETASFSTLNGTSNNAGPYMWGIYDLTLDANSSARKGTGRALAIFGYDYTLQDLYIQHCPGDCVFSTWGNEGGGAVPVAAGGSVFSSNWNHVLVWGANGNGITYNGPSDSRFRDMETYQNGAYGILMADNTTTGATPINTELLNVHAYGNGSAGVAIDSEIHFDDLQSESNQGQCHASGLCTGTPTGGPGVIVLATSTHGQLVGSHLYVWANHGDGLELYNPGNGGTVGNNIAGFQSYSNTGNGLALNLGYNGPNTVITGFNINHNTLDGVNACVAGASGGAYLTMSGGEITKNSAMGFQNCMQEVRLFAVHVLGNTGNGWDSTGARKPALFSIEGEFEGNGGTNIALGTLVANNTINVIVYTGSGETCWSGTPGSTSTVIINCQGAGTNDSVSYLTGTLYSNGTAVTMPPPRLTAPSDRRSRHR